MNEEETQKVLEEYRKQAQRFELFFYVESSINFLAMLCGRHSCSDCPLEPREATKCAYTLLKEQYDYIQSKLNKEVKKT